WSAWLAARTVIGREFLRRCFRRVPTAFSALGRWRGGHLPEFGFDDRRPGVPEARSPVTVRPNHRSGSKLAFTKPVRVEPRLRRLSEAEPPRALGRISWLASSGEPERSSWRRAQAPIRSSWPEGPVRSAQRAKTNRSPCRSALRGQCP